MRPYPDLAPHGGITLMLSLFRFMRQRLIPLLLVCLLARGLSASAKTPDPHAPERTSVPTAPVSSAKAAILLNGTTGDVYCEKNSDLRLPMASTTKIMTALVAVESMPLDTLVTVTPEAVGIEGSSVYLYAGETLTLRTLLYALLLESANDAAVAIAVAVSGSVEAFSEEMNARAQALGLSDSHFENPHGLDSEGHYTTAHDLARITAAALADETLREIVSTYRITVPQRETDGVRLFINHNRLLRTYDGCIGVKTGYTRRSGRCLVSAAERDGLLLIAVTLNASDDWNDHAALLDYGFSRYTSVPLTESGRISYTLPVLNGIIPTATVSYETEDGLPPSAVLPIDHGEIKVTVLLPRHLWGDYERGDTVGSIVFSLDGDLFLELPLTLDTEVRGIPYTPGIVRRVRAFFRKDRS